MTLISAHDLSVARGDRTVLRGITLQVGAGEALHLHGPNGCGKTSLLEVLCGLRTPQAGSVTGNAEPENLHWVGHRNALNPQLSAAENLLFWCRLQEVSGDGVESALQRVGLWKLSGRPCGALSVGQKRRVVLARLVAVRRPLWLLDEPLAGLDADSVQTVMDMLRAHLAQDGAAVITSHQDLPGGLPGLRRMELG